MKITILFLSLCFSLYCGVSNFSTYNPKTIKCISIPCTNGFDNIISDEEFTWTRYNLDETMKFIRSYKGNMFSNEEIEQVYKYAKQNRISVLVLITKIELESSLITWGYGNSNNYFFRMAWCLGAGMYQSIISNGHYIKPYSGFKKQIEFGANRLRFHYDSYKVGIPVYINEGAMKVYPKNAPTYVLFRYTPYWGMFEENGVKSRGNEIFMPVYNRFKNQWKKINGGC